MPAMPAAPPRRRRLAALLACGLAVALLAPLDAVAERKVEVYRVQYRSADELLPLVQTALAGEGNAAVDRGTNSLILIGAPGAVAAAMEVLASQDRKLRTIAIHYGTRRQRELEARGVEVRWTAEAGDFRIGNVAPPPGGGSSVRVRAEERSAFRDEELGGVMRVTEGQRTRIETGTTRPFTTRGPFGTNTEFVTASDGFEAGARILGDGRVEVDLLPFAGRFLPGGAIEQTGGGTTVTLTPGETTVVGGLSRSTTRSQDDLLTGARDRRSGDELVLLLRAEVE